MTNEELIAKIKVEIERRFREYNKDSNHHLQAAEDAELLSFLDTLEESEKQTVPIFDKDSQIRILKDIIQVLTGKDSFEEALKDSIIAIHFAKSDAAQEQMLYDAYELLETSALKLLHGYE